MRRRLCQSSSARESTRARARSPPTSPTLDGVRRASRPPRWCSVAPLSTPPVLRARARLSATLQRARDAPERPHAARNDIARTFEATPATLKRLRPSSPSPSLPVSSPRTANDVKCASMSAEVHLTARRQRRRCPAATPETSQLAALLRVRLEPTREVRRQLCPPRTRRDPEESPRRWRIGARDERVKKRRAREVVERVERRRRRRGDATCASRAPAPIPRRPRPSPSALAPPPPRRARPPPRWRFERRRRRRVRGGGHASRPTETRRGIVAHPPARRRAPRRETRRDPPVDRRRGGTGRDQARWTNSRRVPPRRARGGVPRARGARIRPPRRRARRGGTIAPGRRETAPALSSRPPFVAPRFTAASPAKSAAAARASASRVASLVNASPTGTTVARGGTSRNARDEIRRVHRVRRGTVQRASSRATSEPKTFARRQRRRGTRAQRPQHRRQGKRRRRGESPRGPPRRRGTPRVCERRRRRRRRRR